MSPTFGFLYGMILASFFIAYLSKNLFNKKIIRLFLAISLGAAIIFVCGITHLAGYIGLEKALTAGLYPFIYSEFLKITLAILVAYLLIKKN
jgi:biotin transporter BioY